MTRFQKDSTLGDPGDGRRYVGGGVRTWHPVGYFWMPNATVLIGLVAMVTLILHATKVRRRFTAENAENAENAEVAEIAA